MTTKFVSIWMRDLGAMEINDSVRLGELFVRDHAANSSYRASGQKFGGRSGALLADHFGVLPIVVGQREQCSFGSTWAMIAFALPVHQSSLPTADGIQ
jgi:hypothetical protein